MYFVLFSRIAILAGVIPLERVVRHLQTQKIGLSWLWRLSSTGSSLGAVQGRTLNSARYGGGAGRVRDRCQWRI